jgi:hypothetical protein
MHFEASQVEVAQDVMASAPLPYDIAPSGVGDPGAKALYPTLGNYMGLEITEELVASFVPQVTHMLTSAVMSNHLLYRR